MTIRRFFVSTAHAAHTIVALTAACTFAVVAGCSSDNSSTTSPDGGSGGSSTGGSSSTGGKSTGGSSGSGASGGSGNSTSSGGSAGSGASGGSGGTTGTGGSSGGGGSGATCSAPGGAVTGKANDHCESDGGSMITQATGACETESTDAGAPEGDGGISSVIGGDYGDTNYGTEAFDDDCKYDVKWSSTPICESTNVTFTVTAKLLANTDSMAPVQKKAGDPLTGAAPMLEVFKIESNNSVHLAPVTAQVPTETTPGTYTVGPIKFDESGQWIMRFHFNEDCADDPEDSPHGHAAFYINVP